MEGIAVLLLLMCIIALGVQGESLEDREASCPRDKRFQLKCRKCFEVLDADYEKTLGPYSGSVAQKTCPSCNVQFPNKVLSSTLECRGNTKATLYRWFGPRCNCPDAGHCADYLHKDYKYTKGTLFGSVAVKKCNRTCAVGYVSLKKRTCKKTKLWSNRNPKCKCHLDHCPATLDDDDYNKTLGNSFRSEATRPCDKKCNPGYLSLVKHKCKKTRGNTLKWSNPNGDCDCYAGGAVSDDDQTSGVGFATAFKSTVIDGLNDVGYYYPDELRNFGSGLNDVVNIDDSDFESAGISIGNGIVAHVDRGDEVEDHWSDFTSLF